MKPVVCCTLTLGAERNAETWQMDRTLIDDIAAAVPELREATTGLFDNRQGLTLPILFGRLSVVLQRAAGADVALSNAKAAGPARHYQVAYEQENADVGVAAGQLALSLLNDLTGNRRSAAEHAEATEAFLRFAEGALLRTDARALVNAATARRIPWVHLGNAHLIFGHGRHQRRLYRSYTDKTSHLAVVTADDKALTAQALRSAGLPVPRQLVARSSAEAVGAAETIGYPVVVKPRAADYGLGVRVCLSTADDVAAAFHDARHHSADVVVERWIDGREYRMLVIDGRMVAAAERVPARVTGDGCRSVLGLIDAANRDPRRGAGKARVLTRLLFDEDMKRVLDEQGYRPDSIPAAGETVFLRRVTNLSAGGTSIDVTDRVHADNRSLAVTAAQVIGLDIAGVDFLTADIGSSHKEIGGSICEVNPTPGLRMHFAPSEGEPRDVSSAVIELLFPPGMPSRIPLVAIVEATGASTVARTLTHMLQQLDHTVGVASDAGTHLRESTVISSHQSGPDATRTILADQRVSAAVVEIRPAVTARQGLGFDECGVAVITAEAESAIARGENTDAMLLVLRVVRDMLVLDAEDERCAFMMDKTSASRVCLVGKSSGGGRVQDHVRGGNPAVVVDVTEDGPWVVLYDSAVATPIVRAQDVASAAAGAPSRAVRDVLFAVAAAYGLGEEPASIGSAFATRDRHPLV